MCDAATSAKSTAVICANGVLVLLRLYRSMDSARHLPLNQRHQRRIFIAQCCWHYRVTLGNYLNGHRVVSLPTVDGVRSGRSNLNQRRLGR